MEIKTAYSILEKYLNHEDNPYKISLIETAMKEYTEQFIDSSYQSGYSDGRRKSGGWEVNQKESILKIKQLIK